MGPVRGLAVASLSSTIMSIRALGKKAGVAVKPKTPAAVVEEVIETLDLILVMSVEPGFGGQSFIPSQLEKIEQIRRMIDTSGREIDLEVDGGIDATTAPKAIAAGADVLVAGTATFKGGPDHYAANISALRSGGD